MLGVQTINGGHHTVYYSVYKLLEAVLPERKNAVVEDVRLGAANDIDVKITEDTTASCVVISRSDFDSTKITFVISNYCKNMVCRSIH